MKKQAIALCLALLVSCVPALSQDIANSDVLTVHGVLSRNGKAGTLWTLKPDGSPKFREETVLRVTFTTKPGEASRAYGPYEEKYVELVGEVKSVFHGDATLSKIRTIGILESPPQYPFAGVPAALLSPSVSSSESTERIGYQHAYYLFLASPPTACEACYVPLLITHHPLEETAKGPDTDLSVVITTYERESIWGIRGATPIDPASIEVGPRIIHALGKSYRYQEISPTEVFKLLEEPLGTIPISRLGLVRKTVPGASLNELKQDFSAIPIRLPRN